MEGMETFSDNSVCQSKCYALYQKSTCSCILLSQASILNENNTGKICRREINYKTKNGLKTLSFGDHTLGNQSRSAAVRIMQVEMHTTTYNMELCCVYQNFISCSIYQ